MTDSIFKKQVAFEGNDTLGHTEAGIAMLRSMVRQVSEVSVGDPEFEAEVKKSLNVALADVCRWYLLLGTETGQLEIVIPEREMRYDA